MGAKRAVFVFFALRLERLQGRDFPETPDSREGVPYRALP